MSKALKTYVVVGTNIRHNGKLYREGETIKLSAKAAQRLSRFLKEVEEEKAKTESQAAKQES